MTCVLIISSDQAFASALTAEVAAAGWQAVVTADVRPTVRALYDRQPQAIVLDTDPAAERTPWLILSRIREVSDLPVLVFARGEGPQTRIDALRLGADDAVSSTCAPSEIVMRVRGQIHHHPAPHASRTVTLGDDGLTYDAELRELTLDGKTVSLTAVESRLLLRLLLEPDRFLTSVELTQALWGDQATDRSEAIKVYVHRLRAKMQSCSPQRSFITNRRDIGYRFR